jgi:phage N-6-adenine-methyltransferase
MSTQSQHLKSLNSRKKQDWETPTELFDRWTTKLALTPILDVCADNDSSKCERYYDKDDDALSKDWLYPWFMNPPYDEDGKWVKYAWKQFIKYKQDGLIIVFNKTDVSWFHEVIYDIKKLKIKKNIEVYFEKGRVKFLDNGEVPDNPAPRGVMIIVFSTSSLKERRKRCGR